MKKTTVVAFLLLITNTAFASDIMPEINEIESSWATIYYSENPYLQEAHYPALIKKAKKLANRHPNAVEPRIWQAILISSNAAYETPLKALNSIDTAKQILERTISIEPKALEGAALVVLGTLYYMTPGWPISFGNENKAEDLFKRALIINPKSIDTNYFYGDFLLTQNDVNSALQYFKRAIESPIRPHQKYADTQLKNEAILALKNNQTTKISSGKNRFFSLFSSASSQ